MFYFNCACRAKSRDSVHKPHFWGEKGEPKRGAEPASFRWPAERLTTRPNRLTRGNSSSVCLINGLVPGPRLLERRLSLCLSLLRAADGLMSLRMFFLPAGSVSSPSPKVLIFPDEAHLLCLLSPAGLCARLFPLTPVGLGQLIHTSL